MSDYGDFCREQRQHRQAVRRHWHECPHCAVRFGTGTLVAPGERCRHDGWQAPGESGDDLKAVDGDRAFIAQKIAERKEAKRSRPPPICSCGKTFATHRSLHDHRKDTGHKP